MGRYFLKWPESLSVKIPYIFTRICAQVFLYLEMNHVVLCLPVYECLESCKTGMFGATTSNKHMFVT